jgi:hypothetical protein
VPRNTAALLVLILAAATVRPIACAWWCAPGEIAHASCHDQSSADGVQLVDGLSCDIDVLDASATLSKTATLERMAFVPSPAGGGIGYLSIRAARITGSPPGTPQRPAAHRLTVLRI